MDPTPKKKKKSNLARLFQTSPPPTHTPTATTTPSSLRLDGFAAGKKSPFPFPHIPFPIFSWGPPLLFFPFRVRPTGSILLLASCKNGWWPYTGTKKACLGERDLKQSPADASETFFAFAAAVWQWCKKRKSGTMAKCSVSPTTRNCG